MIDGVQIIGTHLTIKRWLGVIVATPSSSSSSTGSNRSGSSGPTATDAVARQQLEQTAKENARLKADLESSNKALAACQKEAEELSREVGWLQLKNDIFMPYAEKELGRRVNEMVNEIIAENDKRAAQEKKVAEWNAFSPFHPPL